MDNQETPQNFQRAHGDEQKQLRITQFLNTAAQLYEEDGYDKVSLTKIARQLNFHRNNVYNYFNCKEDLFLTLLLRDLEEALADINVNLKTTHDTASFAHGLTQIMLHHLRLLELFSLMNSTIICNASANIHKKLRIKVKCFQDQLVESLHSACLSFMSKENIITLFRDINRYALGTYPYSFQYKERHHIPIYQNCGYETIDFDEEMEKFILNSMRNFQS